MERALTRGQPAALASIGAMLGSTVPHAILLVGSAGSGKTTLALDLAAVLLCTASARADRPCRECRGCRMVASGNHPDLHRLGPEGPGGQILIGGRSGQPPGIRDLIARLALLPVEGGHRVAIIEQAHRMNDDAQSALLKTLEEPPAGVVIVLCADEEERLLPTIRSRTARVRLGPVAIRDIEAFLADRTGTDPPQAARIARLASGRPGVALALALAPTAVSAREEIARSLLDLARSPISHRLSTIRDVLARAADAVRVLEEPVGPTARTRPRTGRRASPAAPGRSAVEPGSEEEPSDEAGPGTARQSAAERRRSAAFVLETWSALTRDLLLARLGELGRLHDPSLIEDLQASAPLIDQEELVTFLARIARSGELLEANLAPELLLDALAVGWPSAAAARPGPPR
jgi:DNA polymerase III delta' subunit